MGLLKKAELITIGSGSGKSVRLTTTGLAAQTAATKLIADVEARWVQRFGRSTVENAA